MAVPLEDLKKKFSIIKMKAAKSHFSLYVTHTQVEKKKKITKKNDKTFKDFQKVG